MKIDNIIQIIITIYTDIFSRVLFIIFEKIPLKLIPLPLSILNIDIILFTLDYYCSSFKLFIYLRIFIYIRIQINIQLLLLNDFNLTLN
jgi:hypothetical protein